MLWSSVGHRWNFYAIQRKPAHSGGSTPPSSISKQSDQ
nr:MAG TPA: hypothetical protein [Caudoviricetes sp.]